MNHDARSSGGAGLAVAILLLVLLIFVGLIGLGAGMFWVRSVPVASYSPVSQAQMAATPVTVASTIVATYPLAQLDIKDSLEAAAITITPGQQVLVAYASQLSADERGLYLVRSTDGGQSFGQPLLLRQTKIFTSISQSRGKEVKRPVRLLPQLASGGGKVFLGWLEPNADNTTVLYYVAESTDDGATFGKPLRVHESDGALPNFISLAADEQGNVAASWLDNRAGVKQPFAAVKLTSEEAFQPETQVYSSPNESGVCPCCPTAVVISPSGQVIVAFRNQLDGYRDIYIASRELAAGSEFSPAESVVQQPTWLFDGCPHDGPSLAVDETVLWVAWMDASSGTPTCYYTARPTGDSQFQAPDRLNDDASPTSPQGNARLQIVGQGLIAAWEQQAAVVAEANTAAELPAEGHQHTAALGGSRDVQWKSLSAGPAPGFVMYSPGAGVAPREGAFQSRPAIARNQAGESFVVFNELDEQGKRVVIARRAP